MRSLVVWSHSIWENRPSKKQPDREIPWATLSWNQMRRSAEWTTWLRLERILPVQIDNRSAAFPLNSCKFVLCKDSPYACFYSSEHWLGSNRLFIGINFSHTSGTSFRTAVGIVYNYDQSHKITGFPFYIESGTTIIHSLETHFIKPILDFKNRSKGSVWPSHLMIYRGGLSEGDYLHALKIEKSAIRNLLNKLRTEHKAPQIGFTIITVQRQHKFRIVPVQGEKNLPIGTTITQSIVDPKKEQWITLSHASFQVYVLFPHQQYFFQGLPKPSVYTVIADESPSKKRIPSEELINLSYDLCYNHGSILSPVSSPSYMYWAGQVAKRGANNLSVAAYIF